MSVRRVQSCAKLCQPFQIAMFHNYNQQLILRLIFMPKESEQEVKHD